MRQAGMWVRTGQEAPIRSSSRRLTREDMDTGGQAIAINHDREVSPWLHVDRSFKLAERSPWRRAPDPCYSVSDKE
jgi:hypothetical protein